MSVTHIIYKIGIGTWNVLPFKKRFALLIKSLRLPVEKLYCDLWFEGTFEVGFNENHFNLVGTRDDKGTLEIFWKGLEQSWDAVSIKVWGKLAKDAKVVFDVGANMGLYSIAAKTENPHCEVYAFEPSRKVLEKLKENIDANKYEIFVVPQALSNQNGSIEFYDLNNFTAVASLKPNENILSSEDLIKYDVKVSTMKNFVEANNIDRIDLISIDVEMNEPEVLEGMGELIGKFKPDFLIEVLNNEVGAKIEKYLSDRDYIYFEIDEERGLKKSERLSRNTETGNRSKSYNFLACKIETVKKLGLNLNSEEFQTI